MNAVLAAVPLLPLVAAAGALCFGRRLRWGGGELIVVAVGMCLIALVSVKDGAHFSTTWLATGSYRLTVGIELNALTKFVALVVSGTALGVALYSLGYMADKHDRPRFFAEIGLFVGAMLMLVLADSLILLFAAWEMVGVGSYLLIGFRYDDEGAPEAASKAFLMTRIGDTGLLLGWLLALAVTGSTDIATLVDAAQGGQLTTGTITLMAFFFLAGAIGKSAQLPLVGWLPDAMIGPTPVSALLHSATMVAAGVFLILRLYPLFLAAPVALAALFWIGAATAVVAGLVATAETDLKRVLAWSTSSQLGEMMIALGLGGPVAASYHLAAHAAFKSALFLAAGSVQEQSGTRDLRRLGGLFRMLPVTGTVFLVAALALAGVPPLAGFWSEDAILAVATRQGGPATALLIVLLMLLAGLYIGRAATAIFLGSRRGAGQIREPGRAMVAGMILMALGAAGLGWILSFKLGAFEPQIIWSVAGIAASLGGLGIGGARAWRGAAPALGSWPSSIGAGLMATTMAIARWTMQVAAKLNWVERQLDHAVRVIANAVNGVAASTGLVESTLDAAARGTATATWRLARDAEVIEALGFGRGGDRIAAGIAFGGERLRLLQSGQLYLYTLSLFLWAAAALVAGGLLVWL